jgi:hypothetical protein
MVFRCQGVVGTRETRTQGASIAALLARLRTRYRAAQCVLEAETPFFGGLPQQAQFPGARNRLGAALHVELAEDAQVVPLDGAEREVEPPADLGI